jgi:hypothetical protein
MVVVFFILRLFSPSTSSTDSASGETLTTPRSDIDLIFGSEGGGDSNGASGTGESAPSGQPAHYCTDESRDVETCEDIDEPVCGWFDLSRVECPADDPCVRSVFPNTCEACQNDNIEYWTEGDCPIHTN